MKINCLVISKLGKGIIIDIGFESDIKDVINKIESELKSTDFDSALKLSDSFKPLHVYGKSLEGYEHSVN